MSDCDYMEPLKEKPGTPRDVANEIIEDLDNKAAKLHPVDALMVLSYVKEHLTAHVQSVLMNAYTCELKARKGDDDAHADELRGEGESE